MFKTPHKVTKTIYVTKDQAEAIARLSAHTRIRQTQLIRHGIEMMLEYH